MQHACYVETDATHAAVRMPPLVALAHKAHHDRLRRIHLAAVKPFVRPKPVMKPKEPDPNYPPFNIQTLHYHQMWFFDLVTERLPGSEAMPQVSTIMHATCLHFGVSRTDMLSARRDQSIAIPRMVGMYLARTLSLKSFPEIGRRFGRRDHTTIMHGVRRVEEMLKADEQIIASVAAIKASLR